MTTAARWSSSSRLGGQRRATSALIKTEEANNLASRPKTAANKEISNSSSLIRPLSGKVFIRRTVKRGWMAKAIDTDYSSGSIVDLEDDELSDGADSFFEDDFNEDTREESLGKLLNCNTLGVESKNQKADWISGELAIPKFHCPRCRDHWYGISAFPCDEELARLIREGKWYTGKGESLRGRKGNDIDRERMKQDSEMNSHSSDSLTLPDIKIRKGRKFQTTKSDRHIDFLTPNLQREKKKNRRITFNLGEDNEYSSSNNEASNTSLDDTTRRRYRPNSATKGNSSDKTGGSKDDRGDRMSGSNSGNNLESSLSGSDVNSSSSTTFVQGKDKTGSEREGDSLFDDGLKRKKKGRDSDGQNGSSNTKLFGSSSSGETGDSIRGKDKGRKERPSDIDGNGGNNSNGLMNSSVKNDGDNDRSTSSSFAGQKTSNETGDSRGSGNNEMRRNDGNGGDNGSGKERNNSEKRNGKGYYRSGDSKASSQRSSRANSLYSGSQKWGESEDRELVKGKGYMRASNPSQSEWGDPTHARIWASNTATSSRVSLANSSSFHDKDDNVPTLPPIIHRKKENPFGSLDFLDGFELTRAFTFSYY